MPTAETGEWEKWGETSMVKIGVCRQFLQRPENPLNHRPRHIRTASRAPTAVVDEIMGVVSLEVAHWTRVA